MPVGFFQNQCAAEPAYARIRDDSEFCDARHFIETLWDQFSGKQLADAHFQADAPLQFHQRFWEMYLACALLERGFCLKRIGGEGLEYYIDLDGRRLWIEAVAPKPGDGPNSVPQCDHSDEGMCAVPVEAILRRITQSFEAKLKAYQKAVGKGLVKQGEQFILALNPRAIPDWPLRTEIPLFIKALLPLGNQQFSIGPSPQNAENFPSHELREKIFTAAGAPVSTSGLLSDDALPVVAVLHSTVDAANCPPCLGADFELLLNPRADPALSTSRFDWARQYSFRHGMLTSTLPHQTFPGPPLPDCDRRGTSHPYTSSHSLRM